jgi:diguanylate cyclase (GGDEF)-like protein
MMASLALAERREHVIREDTIIVAFGDGRLGGAVLFAHPVDADTVRAASVDLRRMLAEFVVSRTSGERTAPEPRSPPEWLTPDTIEGLGAALCEAARRLTNYPTAVVTRDPLTFQASVTAVSAGADRRLMRMDIAPTSVVGRACIGAITAAGEGGELFGTRRYNRRRREERGEVYSLSDGSQGVGALVVFNGVETIDPKVMEQVRGLADTAGPILGRTVDLYAARHRAMTDELTGQPNKHALDHAMREHASGPCSLLSVNVDQLDSLAPPAATAALKHVARIFRRSLRDYDVPARVTDEDFALFLPDTPFHHAFEVAERVRIAVSEEIFDWAGGEHLLTCSFGVASVPEASETPEGLLEAASAALQEARREGSNRISTTHSQFN